MNKTEELTFKLVTIIICGIFFTAQFHLINYDKNFNPDVLNYIANYNLKNYSYDLGFEIYQSILRDFFHLEFNSFWLVSLVLMVILYVKIGHNFCQIPILFANYLFLAQVMGTQIRYFLASLVFLYLYKNTTGKIKQGTLIIPGLIHYGVLIEVLGSKISNILSKYIEFIIKRRVIIFIILVFLYFICGFAVNAVLPYTRFSYYKDSFYMEGKSATSLTYAIISFIFITEFISRHSSLHKEKIKEVLLGALLLFLVIATSSIAVLSGRILLFYIIFEVMLSKVIFETNVKFYCVFVFICLVKLIPMTMSLMATIT